ncbi:protein EPIDERMAL PATTERNING FACTOR 1 [Dendrobium catenatum]|uniref:Epidermal patterning factor-like protein n=1 Tax=Dendrobium catenatum TaxID=906689 RepID=A0A2I0WQD7_9ASPA|nr:protein EPIDERMAL PATTERNING FACTOR 1 [Dendrobium catenatum]PKU77875.1 Protein EPIDERMAL PATTERNING FACTOR 1 [Dendrobium catenatum]
MTLSSPPLSIFIVIVLLPSVVHGRQIDRRLSIGHNSEAVVGGQKEQYRKEKIMRALMERRPSTLMVAGSSLPNCSHACGSCTPCRLVMVSFICEEEAETCPMAYKCMCNSKSYPVP